MCGIFKLRNGCSHHKNKFLDSQSLKEMGTKDMDFVQLNRLIGQKTGGISVYPFTSSLRGKEEPCSHMIVRGKAMSSRTEDLFNLVNSFILVRWIVHFQLQCILYWCVCLRLWVSLCMCLCACVFFVFGTVVYFEGRKEGCQVLGFILKIYLEIMDLNLWWF